MKETKVYMLIPVTVFLVSSIDQEDLQQQSTFFPVVMTVSATSQGICYWMDLIMHSLRLTTDSMFTYLHNLWGL